MDLNIVNNEDKFLSGKLEGYSLKDVEHKFDNYLEMMDYRTYLMEEDPDYPPENFKIFCMKV